MASHLEHKLAVAALIEKLALGEPPDRQSAEDEWPGAETEILSMLLAFATDDLDAFDLADPLFGYEQIAMPFFKDLAGGSRHA